MVESLPEVLAWACRHLPGSAIADLPPRQSGHVPQGRGIKIEI